MVEPKASALHRRLLIAEDDAGIRFGISDFLSTHGYDVVESDSCASTLSTFRATPPDLAILDYDLRDGNAIELLPTLKEIDASVPIIILTGHGTIDLAVTAIKRGAEQFLTKPVELPALLVVVERLLENQRDRRKRLAEKPRAQAIDPFLGHSSAIRRLKDEAHRLLDTESPLLIQGETGVGKGVLASWIHRNGPRAEEPMVDLNCAGLTRELMESELFGHEKGAFTGAVGTKPGLLEIAHRGTVFLDEIGDVDVQVQPKLLKVLEEKRFRRVGDVRDRAVDIRLIAATHQDLAGLVSARQFRSDLFFRISALPLRVPALRERPEDIPLLARRLLPRFAKEVGRGQVDLSDDAVEALRTYAWPGNIRELRNVLERALLLSDGTSLTRKDLRFELTGQPTPLDDDLSLTLKEVERLHIERVLRAESGRVEAAARRLDIPRSTLYQRIKKLGISLSDI